MAADAASGLRFLRRREVRLARAILDAFVAHEDGALPDPTAIGALEELDRLLARLPPEDRRRARFLLLLVEWAPLLVAGLRGPRFWRRFTRLGLAARREVLEALGTAWLLPLRAGYTALKALVMLAYWTRDAAWPAIGYDGPWLGRVPVEAAPVPRPGLT
jgi:hypothetical protein